MNDDYQTPQQPPSQVSVADFSQQVNASIMALRLSPDQILEGLYQTLSGITTEVDYDESGQPYLKPKQVSNPLVNERGLHRIMQKVRAVVNTQVVQGNWKEDEDYYNYCAGFREELAEEFMCNIKNWDIDETDYDYIIDMIMNTLRWYATRSLDDKERQSYSMYKEVYTNQQQKPTKGWKVW